ncbi:MAG: KaiC-like protein 2 [Promethearchaeota archaeon]|nr:MAG: KaiC-like protein 2 [Candidatus Lokiarchaeota archaeon]
MKSIRKIPSGIEGFDIISLGGIPKNRMTLISGIPGSGKTIFCAQFLIGGIQNSNEPGVFVTFEESPEEIITNMQDFNWNIQEHINSGLWKFVDVSPKLEDNFTIRGNYDLSGLILRIKTAIKTINAKRVVLDSIAALFSKYPDTEVIRKEIVRIKSSLKKLKVTSIITSEQYKEPGNTFYYDVMDFVSDNVILLKNSIFEEFRRRTIEIFKYRGVPHKKGQNSFTIKKDKGIVIISFERNPNLLNIKRERSTTGIKQLDELTDGGFFQGSSILLSGETGSGKTLFSLSMLDGSLEKGDRCMMINLEESREQILQKARNWNIDLEHFEKQELFQLKCMYPESYGIEDFIVDIKESMEIFNPDRVYIDSISALERITTPLTFRESLINLFLSSRERNIIAIFTTTAPTFSGLMVNSKIHISTLSDAIILLRYFEREGKMTRALGIMKLRGSNHSKWFTEYSIDDSGINILEPIKKNTGVFTSLKTRDI